MQTNPDLLYKSNLSSNFLKETRMVLFSTGIVLGILGLSFGISALTMMFLLIVSLIVAFQVFIKYVFYTFRIFNTHLCIDFRFNPTKSYKIDWTVVKNFTIYQAPGNCLQLQINYLENNFLKKLNLLVELNLKEFDPVLRALSRQGIQIDVEMEG
ncbi:MAG: hypothetical protein R2879_02095 [Saprospiraceae bacterium]